MHALDSPILTAFSRTFIMKSPHILPPASLACSSLPPSVPTIPLAERSLSSYILSACFIARYISFICAKPSLNVIPCSFISSSSTTCQKLFPDIFSASTISANDLYITFLHTCSAQISYLYDTLLTSEPVNSLIRYLLITFNNHDSIPASRISEKLHGSYIY